jgi:tRNA modification GTPase
MTSSDTIFALSSGAGMAGIGVIRVSGPKAGDVLYALTGDVPRPRFAVLRKLADPSRTDIIDQCLVLWMPAPASATGEDIAEFHVHGSAAVIDRLFTVMAALPQVRMAEPGEFMRRAFANGKLDLIEIEGLSDLLHAKTEEQRKLAIHHAMGGASSVYERWRGELLDILAYLEAAIDFVEEDGVAETALTRVRPRIGALTETLVAALREADKAGLVRDGVRIVFCGPPNVGKSSLLNAIAQREAAIVSPHPGTTRDVIEVPVVLAGVPVILTDTAGLRDGTTDEIEKIGIARARSAADAADICVWLSACDVADLAIPPAGAILRVTTKADLPSATSIHIRNESAVLVSATTGQGIAELVEVIESRVRLLCGQTGHAVVVRNRHRAAVADSIRMLNESLTFDSTQLEFTAERMREAAVCLARVTGRIDVEDLLGKIFGEFCIGK